MIKTKNLGNLVYLGKFDVRPFGSYSNFKKFLSGIGVSYQILKLSASPGKFGGGKVFSSSDYIVISSYSKRIKSRNKKLSFYVYSLILIPKSDYEKIKHFLN